MINLINKRILVTGGSGSLGRHIIRELLHCKATKITSLSRDEGLIKEAKDWLDSSNVRFLVGDITDTKYNHRLLNSIDIVFHAAALKDVPMAEKHPREIFKVNIEGILNLLDSSENVERFINISSDKTIGVVNCYGASKLFGEYLVRQTNDLYKGSYLNIRCPNFLGSRGSVLDIWKRQLHQKNRIDVTDPEMTRFFITLSDAAKYIVTLARKEKVDVNQCYYPIEFTNKFLLKDLAKAFIAVYGDSKSSMNIIGIRSGEKIHENYAKDISLLSVVQLTEIIRKIEE